ncbi:MAG: HEAT repeat domain-containing protein [Planctomycetales bacterium]|nr:HEAT repeat domain-containing protein [Planctomycetales bacterium]
MRASLAIACVLMLAPAVRGVEESTTGAIPVDDSRPILTIEVFSDNVQNATAICFDDQGRLYVCETYRWRKGVEDNRDFPYWIMDDLASNSTEDRSRLYKKWKDKFNDPQYFTRYSDRVVRLEDTDGDGNVDTHTVFADQFNSDVDGPAIGLLSGNNKIYLACIPHVWELEDTNNDGVADKRQSLQDGFGVKNSLSGHDLHGLVWGPDGKLYFSVGDRGYNCTTKEGRVLSDPNSGAVFRCNPDGTGMEIFCYGLRNPQEIAFNEYGDLFTVDNNCDQGDSARVCYLLEGGNTGWHLGAQALTTYKPFIDDGQMEQVPHWLSEGVWKLRHEDQPAHILPPIAHLTNGPSGLVFNSGTSLPDRYKNHFLVCDYKGAPNLCFLYSFGVRQSGAGYAIHDEHLFHGGIPNTDVEVGYDGKIYVADFGGGWVRSDAGNIYAMYDKEGIARPTVIQTQKLFANGFNSLNQAELLRLLSHDDIRVRQRAQFTLAGEGADNIDALAAIASKSDNMFARFHAIWGLGQLRAGAQLIGLLKDPSHEIKAQAIRTLGNIGHVPATQIIRKFVEHENPRVRTFAAIAVGKLRDAEAVPNLVNLLEQNDNQDAFERHAAVFALSLVATEQQLIDTAASESAAVRLGRLLALRRQRSPRVADFLQDADSFIFEEAVRAINDDRIEQARAKLAEYSERFASASVSKIPDEQIFRRLINANFRVGTAECAKRLVALAANDRLPTEYRLLSLKALGHFDHPPAIDATLGIYMPLPSRDSAWIRDAISADLTKVFEFATGVLAAEAVQAMSHYGIRMDNRSLIARMRDGRQPVEVRLAALNQLIADRDFSQKLLIRSLLEDEDPIVRNGACRAYVNAFPNEIITTIQSMLTKFDDLDFRTAYDLLANRADDDSAAIVTAELDKMLAGNLFRTVHLDLYLAAQKFAQPSVRAKLAAVEKQFQDDGRTVHALALSGGDVDKGRAVFQNQGICMKCHKAERGGGDAGPELTYIARLRQPYELLDSVLNPNNVVVPGFGSISVVLNNGRVIEGTPVAESDTSVTIKTPFGETITIKTDSIDERSEVRSPMPKQADNLSLLEIRDLMAYLQQLTARQ